MKPITYMALSIAPATALIMYLYLLLRNNKQFGYLLIKAYIAGALAILVLLLSDFISGKLGLTTIRGLEQTLIYSFITVGLGSELGKFLVFRYYILHKPEVDTPIHGIAFSVMTGLGFATVALFLFVFNL